MNQSMNTKLMGLAIHVARSKRKMHPGDIIESIQMINRCSSLLHRQAVDDSNVAFAEDVQALRSKKREALQANVRQLAKALGLFARFPSDPRANSGVVLKRAGDDPDDVGGWYLADGRGR